jgi:SAM-dependent methyltransferase
MVQNTLDRQAWLGGQRRVYRKRYGCLRQVHDLLRYDARYRLFLLEMLFRRFAIPFERQRVFELGFGTGSLLLRFDHTSSLHGSELSESAVDSLERDARTKHYREVSLLTSHVDGSPRFPGSEYDVVLASHVIEHVPDDRETLADLLAHTRPGGHAVFFLPLERPRHNPDHARTYTAAGFSRLLREVGYEPVFVEENFRYASHWVQVLNWPSRARIPLLGTLVEVVKTTLLALMPTSVVRLLEEPLARLHVAPYQLMVLARRAPSGPPASAGTSSCT